MAGQPDLHAASPPLSAVLHLLNPFIVQVVVRAIHFPKESAALAGSRYFAESLHLIHFKELKLNVHKSLTQSELQAL